MRIAAVSYIAFAGFAALAAGCNGGAAAPPPFFSGTLAPQHLYVSSWGSQIGVLQYSLPLTAAARPNFFLPLPTDTGVGPLAVDGSGTLAVGTVVGDRDGVEFFSAPVTGSSTPAATTVRSEYSAAEALTFGPSGDLFVAVDTQIMGGDAGVTTFRRPFTDGEAPWGGGQVDGIRVFGATFDAAGNLYVTGRHGQAFFDGYAANEIFIFVPPYRGSVFAALDPAPLNHYGDPSVDIGDVAAVGTQLFVTRFGVGLDVYSLPLTAASTPAFSIPSAGIESLAADKAGNVYVMNPKSSSVSVYTPPYSARSAPVLTVKVGRGDPIVRIAIGG